VRDLCSLARWRGWIDQADSNFWAGFPDDDEDGEGMDDYFYSAVSPRECASPTSIPRNHSLERLYLLDDVARQLEVRDPLLAAFRRECQCPNMGGVVGLMHANVTG
jgi:hypothetical protein